SPASTTSPHPTPSAPRPSLRLSLLSHPIFHRIPGDDDARSRQRNDLVLARLQSGAWEFRLEVAILGASLCTRPPASFVRGAQLAKSVRLIIFQRPFSRRLLSAPLYRQLFLRRRGLANLGSRSLFRFLL